MKVKKLIEELQKVDSELEVILQKDGEGNGYSPLEFLYDDCVYEPDSSWSDNVMDTQSKPSQIKNMKK